MRSPGAQVAAPPRRKLWLDWQRGLAVLFMVEVHVLDAWLAPGQGQGWPYAVLLMIGGLAAPGFLYMAGLSQALAEDSQERKGIAPEARRSLALRRAGWLLGVAYGFRLAEYALGGAWRRPGGWQDLLKVDILNVIAVGLAISALLTIGRPRRLGPWLVGLAALGVALATPPVAGALARYDAAPPGGGGLPAVARALDLAAAYLYGSWPRANFHVFNWAAFLLAGAAVAPLARRENRPLWWLGTGAALFGIGWLADLAPDLYAHQDFWRTSPAWLAMRLGICLGLTGLLQLVPDAAERPLRWLSTLGRQSLVGYIASVELTYGALAAPLRKSLSFRGDVLGMVAMVGVTWVVAAGWERIQAWRRRARPAAAAAGS